MPRFSRAKKSDSGSAALEFLAFGVPILLVTLVVIQILAAGYLNNLVLDAAMEGAVVASAADGSVAQGEARVKKVLAISAPNLSPEVQIDETNLGGASAVSVSVSCKTNLFMFGALPIVQTAEALVETP